MRTFAQEQNHSHKAVSSSLVRSIEAKSRANHHTNPILHLQRPIGNQAVQRLLDVHPEQLEAGSVTRASTRFGHDFGKISLYSKARAEIQPKLILSNPGDRYEQEADRVADEIDLPEDEGVNTTFFPHGDGGTSGTDDEQQQSSTTCFEPLRMTKVTSGKLHGKTPDGAGLNMIDYFPGQVGTGRLHNVRDAGPFVTANHAGANVQLYGTIPSPCKPELFSLMQTVTYTVNKVNGVSTAEEGKSKDDIRESGRDSSKAPFRQEWLDDDGYHISMADFPSYAAQAPAFSSFTNIEYVKDYVTSLVGSGGTSSVNWSHWLKIESGKVIENEAT